MATFTFYNPRSGTMRSGYWRRFVSRWAGLMGDVLPVQQMDTVDPSLAGPGDKIVAAGGDGTLRSVARHFGVGRKPPEEMPVILLLPAGTSNSVAKSLGIPVAGASWPHYLRCWRRVHVDAGMAGDSLFLLCASAGISASAVSRAERMRKRGTSSWFYARAFAGCLRGRQVKVFEGDKPPVRAKEVILANLSRFAGAVRIGGVDPFDGFLSMTVMSTSAEFIVRGLLSAFHGPPVPAFPVRKARIEGKGEFQIDGEPGGDLPVEVRVLPRAVPMGLPG